MYIGGGRVIGRSDVWVAPIATPANARPLLESSFLETHARFAPGGQWFAYASNETGQMEVYVDRFPERGAKRRVSTSGGGWPRWADDGSEIFYVSSDQHLMVAAVDSGEGLHIGAARRLFAVRPRPSARLDAYPYDVLPAGRGFVVNTLIEDTTSKVITVVLNWSRAVPKQ
jgi:hypothetical protein